MNEITQPAPRAPQSALATMATRFHVEPTKLLDTLKNTAFKGATDAQMMALCVVANELSLNPFTREIYAFPDKSGGIVPVIGVDGWYRLINAHPQFDGIEFGEEEDVNGDIISATCTIHRRDRTHPTVISEYLSECRRNTEPWKQSPRRMLRHRAAIQCARIAFGLSGADPEDIERMERVPVGRVVQSTSSIFSAPNVDRGDPVQAVLPEAVAPSPDFPAHETRQAEKPRRRAPKAQAQEAPPVADNFEPEFPASAPVDEQVQFLMERDGISEADLMAALHRFKLTLVEIKSLGFVSESVLGLAVKDWQTIAEDIAGMKGGGHE